MRYLIVFLIAVTSCDFTTKTQENIGHKDVVRIDDCKSGLIFPKSKKISGLSNSIDEFIPFSLIYKKDTCLIYDNIRFFKMDLRLESNTILDSSIYFGIKSDSLFVGEFYNSKINDILFLFSLNENSSPKEIRNTFLPPYRLDMKNIYIENDKRVFQLESFYDLPHSKLPRFTFYQFFMSKERGIFKVDLIDNKTKEIYSNASN